MYPKYSTRDQQSEITGTALGRNSCASSSYALALFTCKRYTVQYSVVGVHT